MYFRPMTIAEIPEEYPEFAEQHDIVSDGLEDEFRCALIEFDDNDNPRKILGFDQGEPEDNSFGRDWSWVFEEFNNLASINKSLLDTLENIYHSYQQHNVVDLLIVRKVLRQNGRKV